MPAFDPVRDAVLNSPVSQNHPLPSPAALPTPSKSPPTSYFTGSPAWASTSTSSGAVNAVQSPTSARRATDLSVLLNADDRVPSPTYQRRPSSSGGSIAAASTSSGTPRPRSAHLSHILQPTGDDGGPSTSSHTASPIASPQFRQRDILQPSLSRVDTVGRTSASASPSLHHVDPAHRPSSSSGSMAAPRSPQLSRAPSYNNAQQVPPNPLPPKPLSTSMSEPLKPSPIPYHPRHRRTAPSSILLPYSPAEREFYKNLSKNPLRARNLGKRKWGDLSKDDLRPKDYAEPPVKRRFGNDVGLVVEHYNQRPEVGVTLRQQSPIIGLKNFNNWVKSVIIARFAHPVLRGEKDIDQKDTQGNGNELHKSQGGAGKVLDMGCGKGGDLNKWQKAKVKVYVGVDIAAVSIEQARSRYMSSGLSHQSKHPARYDAFFAALDCYSNSLSEIPDVPLPPKYPPFDVVSMQFCMHYAFESVQKARLMLENVTRWLRPGGRFIGTIPNARLLLERLDALPSDQDPNDLSFGNSVYRIRFDDRERRPVFGHRYWFYLQDAVDNVPEYIVQWDNFVQMASEYRLRLLYKAEFHDVFAEHHEHPEFGPLLQRMKVVDVQGESAMDEDQWEAANIYIAFAFEKI